MEGIPTFVKYVDGLSLLYPGNELHLEVHTDTEYDKKEEASHFGLKCQVMGFEWSASYTQSLTILEKELVTLSGMCCGKLLKECSLPWHSGLGSRDTHTCMHTHAHAHAHTHTHARTHTHAARERAVTINHFSLSSPSRDFEGKRQGWFH